MQSLADVNVLDEMYIRDGLTIVGEKALKTHGVRSLVLIDDPLISEFLGDSENPAHTKWLKATKHFRGKYDKGDAILSYIKQSAAKLANFLSRMEEEDNPDLLSDIFGIPEHKPGPSPEPTPGPDDNDPPPPPPPPPLPPKKKTLEVSQLRQPRGFKVSQNEEATTTPNQVRVEVAFDTELGPPLKSYHPEDFNLADKAISITVTGGKVEERIYSHLLVSITDPEFEIKVTGFPGTRDIWVNTYT